MDTRACRRASCRQGKENKTMEKRKVRRKREGERGVAKERGLEFAEREREREREREGGRGEGER